MPEGSIWNYPDPAEDGTIKRESWHKLRKKKTNIKTGRRLKKKRQMRCEFISGPVKEYKLPDINGKERKLK